MILKLSEGIFSVNIDDKEVILDSKTGNYFEINQIGSEIINFLKGEPKKHVDLLNYLLEKYDVDEKILKNELQEFLVKTPFISKVS